MRSGQESKSWRVLLVDWRIRHIRSDLKFLDFFHAHENPWACRPPLSVDAKGMASIHAVNAFE